MDHDRNKRPGSRCAWLGRYLPKKPRAVPPTTTSQWIEQWPCRSLQANPATRSAAARPGFFGILLVRRRKLSMPGPSYKDVRYHRTLCRVRKENDILPDLHASAAADGGSF